MKEIVDLQQAQSINPKGRATIEVFDAKTGRLKHKQQQNNFIAKGVYDYYFKYMMLNTFINGRSINNSHSVQYPFRDLMRNIVLTTATHAEDSQNEWLLRGKIVGYGDMNSSSQSSSDLREGLLNQTESEIRTDYCKFVIDFATDRGNGTFQSVYLANVEDTRFSSSNIGSHFDIPFKNIEFESLNEIVAVQKFSNGYYVGLNDSSNRYFCIFDNDWNLVEQHPISISIYQLCVAKGYIFMTDLWGVHRSSLGTPSDITQISNDRRYGILYDDVEDVIYTANLSSGVMQISKYTVPDFEILETHEVDWPTTVGSYPLAKISNNHYMIGNWFYDKEHMSMEEITNNGVIGYDGNFIYYKPAKQYPKLWIGSRILLNQPVIKSDEDTMKITYELFING